MKKVTWTCWVDEEKKAKGAVVGTRKSVLDWMRKTYPGLRKAWNGEMTPAWYFFWENFERGIFFRFFFRGKIFIMTGPSPARTVRGGVNIMMT